jgi:myosin-5
LFILSEALEKSARFRAPNERTHKHTHTPKPPKTPQTTPPNNAPKQRPQTTPPNHHSFPTATAKDLADKLHAAEATKASARWSRPKTDPSAFTLRHYAGPVTYSTDNFLDKNKDYVVAEHQALLEGSALAFVRELFAPEQPAGAGSEGGGDGATPPPPPSSSSSRFAAFKFNSVGTQFKRQLAELMAQLNAMEPHYVRCIKPNAASAPGVFEGANALHQLRCGGVLEAVRISCAGFPSKTPFAAFADRFWPLVPDAFRAELAAVGAGAAGGNAGGGDRGAALLSDDGARRVAEAALRAAGVDVPEGAQLGRTKVFLRAGRMAVLDKRRLERLNAAATAIQRRVRGVQGRAAARRRRDAVLALQSGARGMLARRRARALREDRAAVAIQAAWRAHVLRRQYQGQVAAVVSLQSAWRAALARRAFAEARVERSALVAQTAWRARSARSQWRAQLEASAVLQRAARCRAASAALRALRAEQREAGKLLQDNQALGERLADAAATLERVQGQRDAARAELKLLRQGAERERGEQAARLAALEAEAAALRARAPALEGELDKVRAEGAAAAGALRAELEAARKRHGGEKAEADKQLKVAQEYIQRLMAERGDLERRLHGMKEELIARLQNACAQRDEARAQAMELEAKLQRSAEEVARAREEGAASAAAAAASAAAVVTAAGPGGAAAAQGDKPGVRGLMQSLASQAPGYARMIADATGGYLAPAGAQQAGAPEHVHGAAAPAAAAAASAETELERRARELQARQQQLLLERRRQEEERLLAALQHDLGFSRGRPVAALAVFRACLQWRAFQADRTTVFDRIIQVVGAQIERHQDDNARLAYWLTNTVTLLALMQKNVKPASSSSSSSLSLAGGLKGRAAAAGRSVLGGLFGSGGAAAGAGGMLGGRGSAGGGPPGSMAGHGGGGLYGAAGRVAASGEASIHGGGVGGFRAVEAKYPALLFKQQLDAFVQKVFPMVRDNVKKAITPLLAHCIHTPRGGGAAGAGGGALAAAAAAAKPGGAAPPAHQSGATAAAAADAQSRAWADILAALDELLATLTAAHVPKPLVRCLFKQLFAFVNVQLFNQLLLRRECCSFSNGEYVKTGLGRVEQWIMEAGPEAVGDSWDELRFIRQAVTFLVVGNKPRKALDDITRDLCPVLSVQQLYRISTMYWDDKYQTETVSAEVLAAMKARMVENAALAATGGGGGGGGFGGGIGGGGASHSFLLDDDSTLPFAAAEVCAQLDDAGLYAAISPLPEALRDAPGGGGGGGGAAAGSGGFAFLEKELRFGSGGSSSG